MLRTCVDAARPLLCPSAKYWPAPSRSGLRGITDSICSH
jgi:hypothetical protein